MQEGDLQEKCKVKEGCGGRTQLKHSRTCGSESHKVCQGRKEIQAKRVAQQVGCPPGMREATGSIPSIA